MDMVAPLPYTYGSVRGPRTNTIPNISIPRHGPSHWRLPIDYSGNGVASIASRGTEASHTMIWLLKWRRKWHCSVRTYLPKWRPGWFNRQRLTILISPDLQGPDRCWGSQERRNRPSPSHREV